MAEEPDYESMPLEELEAAMVAMRDAHLEFRAKRQRIMAIHLLRDRERYDAHLERLRSGELCYRCYEPIGEGRTFSERQEGSPYHPGRTFTFRIHTSPCLIQARDEELDRARADANAASARVAQLEGAE